MKMEHTCPKFQESAGGAVHATPERTRQDVRPGVLSVIAHTYPGYSQTFLDFHAGRAISKLESNVEQPNSQQEPLS